MGNHLVEKEKLVLSVEQEILRVHGRAARALANQPPPYSVCTFMRDENVYTPIDPCEEESLNAVQKMDWEWKLQEINSGIKVKPAIDDLHVPMVQVNEDFDQLVS